MTAGQIPLIVGVTGHRDLRERDAAALEERVEHILRDLRQRYQCTRPLLLSALAEGADRLAARVGLACGARLIAPLPFPPRHYERDFADEASRAEFRELLRRAERWLVVPLEQPGGPLEAEDGALRDSQYASVAAFIVRHSHILLALWDGADTGRVGGTSQVIQYHLQGLPYSSARRVSPLDPGQAGPVYHVVTPRAGYPEPELPPFSVHILRPSDHDGFDRVFARIDGFNRDVLRVATEDLRVASRAQLISEQEAPSLSSSALSAVDDYAAADVVAIEFRKRAVRSLSGLLFAAFVAFTCFSLYAHLRFAPFYLALYLAVIAGAYVWYLWVGPNGSAPSGLRLILGTVRARDLWARRGDHQSKYLDYRALAEGMRVQLFWFITGISDSVADHYLRRQRSELDWIRQGLRAWHLLATAGLDNGQASGEAAYRLVSSRWIDDQHAWFARVTRRDQRRLELKERLVLGCLVLAFVLAVVLLAAPAMHVELDELRDLVVTAIGLLLALVALLEGWAEKMALAEQIRWYQHMHDLFGRASRQVAVLLQEGQVDAVRKLCRELGEAALGENADWVLLHRARPVSVPRGG